MEDLQQKKQASRTKVATKATKSNKTTSTDEHEEDGEFGVSKNWRDSDVEALVALRGEMEPNFVKNAKKQDNSLQFVYEGFEYFQMKSQKSLTIIEVVFSATPKTSPQICNVLPLPNRPSAIATRARLYRNTCSHMRV